MGVNEKLTMIPGDKLAGEFPVKLGKRTPQ